MAPAQVPAGFHAGSHVRWQRSRPAATLPLMNALYAPLLSAALLLPALAHAHAEIISGPATANATEEVTFAIGHGCAGADTVAVRIELPAGVSGVRAMASDFGKPVVERDAADSLVAVSWEKPATELLDSDYGYYKLVLRMKLPNAPFTTIFFPTYQTCRDTNGVETTTPWVTTTPEAEGEPAPALSLLPARYAGWNKFTVPEAVNDLSVYFSGAQIVWKGAAAYSANPTTAALIASTPDVTPLSALAANDEIWVKY